MRKKIYNLLSTCFSFINLNIIKNIVVNIIFALALFAFSQTIFPNRTEAKNCIPGINYELIKNGDFEAGDTLFFTEYINAPDYMRPSRTYAVSYNPQLNYSKFDSCGDHTTGRGKMLVVNGDTVSGTVIWRQTVRNLSLNTDYEFSFWHTSVNKLHPAFLIVLINGDTLKPYPVWLSDSTCLWMQMTYIWNSGAADTAEITILDDNLAFFGNDFALDDISLMPYCRLQACAGDSPNTCKNQPVALNGNAMDGFEPYRFKWMPVAGLDNPNIQNPVATVSINTQYILEVTDVRGCSAYDTITVFVYDEPDNTISASADMPVCPCETVTLSAAPGLTYLWSTGETSRMITVTKPGIYSLQVTDNNGCTSSNRFEVTHRNVTVDVAIDSISEDSGKDIQFYIGVNNENNLFDCNYSSYTAKIKYNASLLIPRKDTPFGTVENGFETISVTGDLAVSDNQPLNFYTLWGDAECTDLTIEEIVFSCDSVNVTAVPGRFCLTDLCDAGGLRLFGSEQNIIFQAKFENNNLKVDFQLEEDTDVRLTLYNYAGNEMAELLNGNINAGLTGFEFSLSTLPKGLYFLVVNAENNMISKPVYIN